VSKQLAQWNSGATRESNLGPRVRIPSALTTKSLNHKQRNVSNFHTLTAEEKFKWPCMHVPATDYQIHLTFNSRVGFSWSADRMVLYWHSFALIEIRLFQSWKGEKKFRLKVWHFITF